MSGVRVFELAMSVVTLTGAWMVGNKSVWGQRMNMAAIAMWWLYIPIAEAWGLIPMQIGFSVIGTRNWLKWEREHREENPRRPAGWSRPHRPPLPPTHMEMG
jgi:hypothetical protein